MKMSVTISIVFAVGAAMFFGASGVFAAESAPPPTANSNAPENPAAPENPTAPAEKFATPPSDKVSLKSVVDKMQHHYNTTNSFSANFKETIVAVGAPKRTRQGTVLFHKPGRMRWEFAQPDLQTIVSDGKQLYSYEPDLNQVVETPLAQAISSSGTAGFLLGIGDISRDFDVSAPKAQAPDGRIHVALKPKASNDRFEVALDPKTYDIVGFTMTDQLGDVTTLEFSDVRDNVALDDAQFSFTVPAGADVVTAPKNPMASKGQQN